MVIRMIPVFPMEDMERCKELNDDNFPKTSGQVSVSLRQTFHVHSFLLLPYLHKYVTYKFIVVYLNGETDH